MASPLSASADARAVMVKVAALVSPTLAELPIAVAVWSTPSDRVARALALPACATASACADRLSVPALLVSVASVAPDGSPSTE